jgi:hypothetical protein
MHQGTKTFSDITAIDTSNLLEVYIELREHNDADYVFSINDKPLSATSGLYKFDLLTAVNLKCEIKTGAVEVVKVLINNKEVLPIYQHLADPATNWITRNWELTIPGPFYPWYHEITGQGWIA